MHKFVVAAVFVLFLGALAVASQDVPKPEGQAPPPAATRPKNNPIPDQFVNLQVLPKDIKKRQLVDVMKQLRESRRFMKGLFAWAGFPSTTLGYQRPARSAGNTKFNGWKLWNLALEGITSFSTAPLRFWTYLGASVAFLSFAYGTYLLLRTLIFGRDMPGYASIFVAVVFLGGLQLTGIGVIGEYLGRTYLEAKQRPVYIARKVYARQN